MVLSDSLSWCCLTEFENSSNGFGCLTTSTITDPLSVLVLRISECFSLSVDKTKKKTFLFAVVDFPRGGGAHEKGKVDVI